MKNLFTYIGPLSGLVPAINEVYEPAASRCPQCDKAIYPQNADDGEGTYWECDHCDFSV